MSFILKALKKLEDEKAARSRPAADLKSVLLTGHGGSGKSGSKALLAMTILLVFIAGSALTYFLARKEPVASSQAIRPAAEPTVNVAAPAPAPVPLPSQASAAQPQEERISHPVARSAAVTPSPARTSAPAHPEKPQEILREVSPPPGLTLNGIAVQDDPAQSVAIVNGIMLKRGMTAQGGATVEDIFPDRVKFAGNGGIFELQLPR